MKPYIVIAILATLIVSGCATSLVTSSSDKGNDSKNAMHLAQLEYDASK